MCCKLTTLVAGMHPNDGRCFDSTPIKSARATCWSAIYKEAWQPSFAMVACRSPIAVVALSHPATPSPGNSRIVPTEGTLMSDLDHVLARIDAELDNSLARLFKLLS